MLSARELLLELRVSPSRASDELVIGEGFPSKAASGGEGAVCWELSVARSVILAAASGDRGLVVGCGGWTAFVSCDSGRVSGVGGC